MRSQERLPSSESQCAAPAYKANTLIFAIPQTVAPNIAKASGRTDPSAAVLGSLACLVDAPEGFSVQGPQSRRMPEGDVVLEIDVATFTDQVWSFSCLSICGLLSAGLVPCKHHRAMQFHCLQRCKPARAPINAPPTSHALHVCTQDVVVQVYKS